MLKFPRYLVIACSLLLAAHANSSNIDQLNFGVAVSEDNHHLNAMSSETFSNELGVSARRLLPTDVPSWRGGALTFDMKVNPDLPTYVTVKLWGGYSADKDSAGRLALYIDGKQVGQRHLGEIDMLDIASESARFPGRFFYKTIPLPVSMTQERDHVKLMIEAQGRVWGYGDTVEKFQKPLVIPSRGIYAVYTHTNPCFVPDESEVQGASQSNAPIRTTPGKEILKEVEQRINSELVKQMRYGDEMRQVFIQFLAKAYLTSWTDVYQRPETLEKILRGIDYRYRVFVANPEIVKSDRETWNHDWFGYGPTADAVRILAEELSPYLDSPIIGTDIPRRQGWADMFAASRDWHVTNRRWYTNQTMIKDTFGTYLCNRAIQIVDPSRAWPEEKAVRLLYESAGLEPWSGNWDAEGKPDWKFGKDYYQLTDAGLTKELGFVGNYGEVIDWMVALYDASRPSRDAVGDPRLREQLIKIARARGVFRYPLIDENGYKAMQLETVVGWRDDHYPGGVTYDQRFSWDGGPFEAAAATLDPVLVGFAQHMLEENQFFNAIRERMLERSFRVTCNLLSIPGDYEKIVSQPDQATRLPMAHGQEDFVFADPQIGVIAVKNGEDILYASLYWRARFAINNLARVHYLTPTIERDATVRIVTQFTQSGLTHTLRDRVNEAQSDRHEKFYRSEGISRAEAGQIQPIAKVPASFADWEPGKENVYAGKGDFYVMEYGPYLVAMNSTADRSLSFVVPPAFDGARDLASGETFSSGEHPVDPRQTVVLYRGE